MKYRIRISGNTKFEKWIKTTKTIEEIKGLIAHPKIQAVEYKE